MLARTLLGLCRRLGIQEEAIWQAERPDAYNLAERLEARALKVPADDEWARLVDAFGDALTLRVRQDVDGPPLLEIEAGHYLTPLSDGLRRLRARADHRLLLFELSLDKDALLSSHGLAGQLYAAHFFLFSRSLAVWLGKPLHEVESWLLVSPYTPTVVTIADASLLRSGPMLALVGLDRLAELTEPPACTAERRSRIDNYLSIARDYVAWRPFELKYLTPLHFAFHRQLPAPEPIGNILVDTYFHLSILYTANRTAYSADRFEATYASPDRLVTVSLERDVDIPEAQSVLPWLARWPLDGKEREKLSVLRTVAARELPADDPAGAYRALTRKLGSILSQGDWHYRVLIEGQIDEHFEQVEKATDFVAGTTKEISDSVDRLARALTESLLGAVGLIVLTILATILKDTVDLDLIRIALVAYAAFLFIFQFLYRMGTTLYSYVLLYDEAKRRRVTYTSALLERVDDLFVPLKRRHIQFLLVFAVTAVLIVGVAAGLWYVAHNLTAALEYLNITLPAPTTM